MAEKKVVYLAKNLLVNNGRIVTLVDNSCSAYKPRIDVEMDKSDDTT